MKIESLNIYGYGKWIDQSFDIPSDFHVFYGKNEAGKTTLMSYLHSVLFGFPTRNSQKLRYEPKQSSRYGGQIHFVDQRLGSGVVERVSGKSSGDVTVKLENGSFGEDELAKQLVYGIDRDLYQQMFSFQLTDLESIRQLKKEDIDRYFVSVGVLGSKNYLRHSDWLEQQAGTLYKPTGRVPKINRQLSVLNKKSKQLTMAKEKNKEYMEIINQIDAIEKDIQDIDQERAEKSEELEKLGQMEKDWEYKLEMDKLKQEISLISIPNLSEDGLYQLKSYNAQIEEIREKQRTDQKKLQEYKEKHHPSELFLAYKENEGIIRNLNNKMSYVNKKYQNLVRLEAKKEHFEEAVMKDLSRERFISAKQLPEIWSDRENRVLLNWQKMVLQKENEIAELNKQLDYKKYQIVDAQKEIDDLENKMWSKEKLQSELADPDPIQKNPESKNTSFMMLGGSVLLFLSSFLFLEGLTQWAAALISVLFFAVGSLGLYRGRKSEDKPAGPGGNREAEMQSAMREDWRNKLAQMDELVYEENQLSGQEEKIRKEITAILKEFSRFKDNYSVPRSVELQDILSKKSTYKELKNKVKQLEDTKEQIGTTAAELEKIMEPVSFIEEFFPVQNTIESKLQSVTHFIKKVNDEEEYLKDYIKDTGLVQNHLEQLNIEEQKKADEKRALLNKAGTDSEEAFRVLYEKKNEKENKIRRLRELKEDYQQFSSNEVFEDIGEIQKRIQNLKINREELNQAEKEKIEHKATLKYDLEKLEAGNEYTHLLQDFENEKSTLQDYLDEWVTYKTASNLIKKTLQKGTKDQLPYVVKDAAEFFKLLTRREYKNILLNKDGIKAVHKNGTSFYASELSRGTAEPLYVALRFAFIKNIAGTLPLPILVDDGFVNFDSERRQAVYQLLQQMSEYTQVLYFTFDENIFEHISKDQCTVLK